VSAYEAEREAVVKETATADVAYLIIKCEKRDSEGGCIEASCEREKDENSPTGFEIRSCAEFLVTCTAAGHDPSGDRNNATCKAKQ
jgi:hypothetical protein